MNIKINLQTILATIGLCFLLYVAYNIGEKKTSHVYKKRISELYEKIDSLSQVNMSLDAVIDSLDSLLSANAIDTSVVIHPIVDSSVVHLSNELHSCGIENAILDSEFIKINKNACINILQKCDSLEQLLRVKVRLNNTVELLHEKVLNEEKKIKNLELQLVVMDSVNKELNMRIDILNKKLKIEKFKYRAIITVLAGYILYKNVIKK